MGLMEKELHPTLLLPITQRVEQWDPCPAGHLGDPDSWEAFLQAAPCPAPLHCLQKVLQYVCLGLGPCTLRRPWASGAVCCDCQT